MSKGMIGCLALAGAALLMALIVGLPGLGSYNSLVAKDEAVNAEWGNVENVYQRRMDLLPNLANTVERYSKHEKETLEAVIAARASATKPELKITPDLLEDPEAMKKFNQAQADISGMFGRLMAVQESYPQLKADQQFLNLQYEISGTENRIAVERRKYNLAVQELNTDLRSAWSGLINSMFLHLRLRSEFKADDGASKAPVLMPQK